MDAKTIKKVAASVIAATVGVSAALKTFVEKEESFGPQDAQGYYIAYPDPGVGTKLPTICNGHTRGVKMGDKATKEQCRKWLEEDLAIASKDVQRCIKVPISQKQYEALTSFNYNTGLLCVSQLARYLNAGACKAAANEFNNSPMFNKDGSVKTYKGKPVMKFTTGGGIPLKGLISRRAKERAMFEGDCEQ